MMRHPTDETILLLAHGELSAWRSLPLQFHLRRCPQCQARYAAFARTSAALAAALRGPDAVAWQPVSLTLSSRFVIASLAALILLAGSIGGFWYFAVHWQPAPSAPVKQARPSEGCLPNLPGDRCR